MQFGNCCRCHGIPLRLVIGLGIVVVISSPCGAIRQVTITVRTPDLGFTKPTSEEPQATSSNSTEDVSLHVIGVSESGKSLLKRTGTDILDWEVFCRTLIEQGSKDRPTTAKRIWELLPKQAQKLVAREVSGETGDTQDEIDSKQIRRHITISEALNTVLIRRDFYREEDFKEVRLNSTITKMLDRRDALTELEVRRLNRLLWDAAFPAEITKSVGGDDIPETVTVRVTKTNRPIILVLSAYKSVRWVVVPDQMVRIKQIIVAGYEPHEITGVDAPVVYKVYKGKGGPIKDYILARAQDDGGYPEMVRRLRKLTGLEITSFQYVDQYEGVPFVVRDDQ